MKLCYGFVCALVVLFCVSFFIPHTPLAIGLWVSYVVIVAVGAICTAHRTFCQP